VPPAPAAVPSRIPKAFTSGTVTLPSDGGTARADVVIANIIDGNTAHQFNLLKVYLKNITKASICLLLLMILLPLFFLLIRAAIKYELFPLKNFWHLLL
jgi:hypothetical protein